MKDRIVRFMSAEGLSSSRLADEIGVQRSSVSHLLGGRNNPSYEFIQKLLSRFPRLNAEWLVMGTGNMYKDMLQTELFSVPIAKQADPAVQIKENHAATAQFAPLLSVEQAPETPQAPSDILFSKGSGPDAAPPINAGIPYPGATGPNAAPGQPATFPRSNAVQLILIYSDQSFKIFDLAQ